MGKSKPNTKSPPPKNLLAISKSSARPKLNSKGSSSSANIKVVVRVRPPNSTKRDDNHRIVVKIVDEQKIIFDPKEDERQFFYHGVEQKCRDLLRKPNKDMQFVFDRVFEFEATNNEIFINTTKPLIQSLMDGYNCSVFAYGATGAGKTHTMLGHSGNPGITYLTMAELFKAREELSSERKFELGITYLEVYNELVRDLLNPGPPLQLREDSKYGVTVAGIKMHKINDPDKLFHLLEQGNNNRTQHPTDANAESSRSHAVFQVYIQMEIKATREMRAAKLSMIDLAGSERGSATGFRGARFTEGANINKSLLALGNCINSLADGQRHVPYRDSKLTRLLKDSLGGNCQTVMVANVSPSSLSYEDTYNTLKYAMRAKEIKSTMSRNIVNVELRAGEYIKIVDELKKELEKVKTQLREKTGEREIDPSKMTEFMKLVEERKGLVERMFSVESIENVVVLRRHFKEEVDNRLSGLCEDTPEKEDLHRRLGGTVDRFQRQEDTFKSELTTIKLLKSNLETKMTELVKKHPELEKIAEVENAKLAQAEAQYQLELEKKKRAVVENELQSKCALLQNTWKILQPCYLQLKGHGYATDIVIKEYQGLVRQLQSFKSITWDNNIDSGMSSLTSIACETENSRPAKRKINDENTNVDVLDHTYVLEAPKPKVQVRAEEMLTKVYETAPKKKIVSRAQLLRRVKSPKSPAGSKILKAHKNTEKSGSMNRRPFRT